MQSIIKYLNGLSSACEVLMEVKNYLLHLIQQDDPALSHAEILEQIRDDFTPEKLYSKDAL